MQNGLVSHSSGCQEILHKANALWNRQNVHLNLLSKLCHKSFNRAVDLEQNFLPSYSIRSEWHRREKPQTMPGTVQAQASVAEPCHKAIHKAGTRPATRVLITQHWKVSPHAVSRNKLDHRNGICEHEQFLGEKATKPTKIFHSTLKLREAVTALNQTKKAFSK